MIRGGCVRIFLGGQFLGLRRVDGPEILVLHHAKRLIVDTYFAEINTGILGVASTERARRLLNEDKT